MFADCCDKLFELFNAFAAENTKKKPQVWPLQMMLLVLCPVSLSLTDVDDDVWTTVFTMFLGRLFF